MTYAPKHIEDGIKKVCRRHGLIFGDLVWWYVERQRPRLAEDEYWALMTFVKARGEYLLKPALTAAQVANPDWSIYERNGAGRLIPKGGDGNFDDCEKLLIGMGAITKEVAAA